MHIDKKGRLNFNKKEEEEIKTVLRHCKADLGYGGGGTFSSGDSEDTPDLKEMKKAENGIKLIEWILIVNRQNNL